MLLGAAFGSYEVVDQEENLDFADGGSGGSSGRSVVGAPHVPGFGSVVRAVHVLSFQNVASTFCVPSFRTRSVRSTFDFRR